MNDYEGDSKILHGFIQAAIKGSMAAFEQFFTEMEDLVESIPEGQKPTVGEIKLIMKKAFAK